MRSKKTAFSITAVLVILSLMGWLVGCNKDAEPVFEAAGVRYGNYGSARFNGSVIITNDLTVSDDVTITDDFAISGDLSVDGTTNLDDLDVDASGEIEFDGGLVDIGGGTGGTADGDNDLLVDGDCEVDETLDVDGDIDLDGTGFDADVSAAISLDAGAATNLSTSAGDITIDAEAGSLVLIGSEGVADSVLIDANDTVTSGLSILVGSVTGLTISGGVTNIGGCSAGTAAGDNDLCVQGDAEVDGILDVDGSVDVDGTAVDIDLSAGFSIDGDTASNISLAAQDLTIEAETGSIIIKGDEAVADAILLDANTVVTSGVTIEIGSAGALLVTGGVTDIGGGSCATAAGDNDLCVAADVEVDGILDVDGSVDVDGTTMAVDISGALSLDAAGASNITTSGAGIDLTLEAGAGSVVVKGDEAIATAITLDANETVTSGLTILVGSASAMYLTGGGLDVNVTNSVSIDADNASNISLSAEDLTIEAETGSIIVKGDEAVADAVLIDANDAVTTGLTINVGSVSGVTISGGGLNMSNSAITNIGAAGTDFSGTGGLTLADALAVTAGGISITDGDMVVADDLRVTAQTSITVTNGAAFTATGTYQPITAAGTVTPTLTVGTAGDVVVLINTSAQTINIADSGTMMLNVAVALGQYDTLMLWCDGTNWLQIATADN